MMGESERNSGHRPTANEGEGLLAFLVGEQQRLRKRRSSVAKERATQAQSMSSSNALQSVERYVFEVVDAEPVAVAGLADCPKVPEPTEVIAGPFG